MALVANLACFFLLYAHRDDNLNMSSTWICSRNDLFANVGVLLAAALCYMSASRWPDIVVGCAIAGLALNSSVGVMRAAIHDFRKPPPPAPTGSMALRFSRFGR